MRTLSSLAIVMALAIATLGTAGTAWADCEPGQEQTFCGPSEPSGNSASNQEGSSVAAQVGNEVVNTWSNAQQTPLEMDQGALGSQSAEAIAELVSPGLGQAAAEARQEAEAEADRLIENFIDQVIDTGVSGVETAVDAVQEGLGEAKQRVNDLFGIFN